MKIWIGKEQEGQCAGQETMFVQSPLLLDGHINTVFALLARYPNVKRLYIGAGRKDCLYITDPDVFVRRCETRNIELVQEMDVSNAKYICPEVARFAEVVLTVRDADAPVTFIQLTFKIDNFSDIILSQDGYVTTLNLSNVEDDLYKEIDTVVYEDYK